MDTTLDKAAILATLTPDIIARFKTAIEIGKWANGDKLTPNQLQTCLQAVMIWEHEHLPPSARTGFVPNPKKDECDVEHDHHYPNNSLQAQMGDETYQDNLASQTTIIPVAAIKFKN